MINVPLGFTKGSYILVFGREEDESPVTAGAIEVLYPYSDTSATPSRRINIKAG